MSQETLSLVALWLILAIAGGIATGAWLVFARPTRPFWPPQRYRAVPWSGAEVVAVFLVYYFAPQLVYFALESFKWPDFWYFVVAAPVQLAGVVLLMRFTSRTKSYQLGLTTHRIGTNVVLGYSVWCVITPAVYLIEFAVIYLYPSVYGHKPEQHPLLNSVETNPELIDWIMFFLLAVVAAPVLEEVLFRGVFQQWFARRAWGGDVALLGAFGFAVYQNITKIQSAWTSGEDVDRLQRLFEAISPALFVLVMIPGYIFADRAAWTWLSYPGAGRAVYGTALLFAAAHSFAWPTPIPLFVLALGLGFLAYRTQSLVGPITLHMLFNSVACMSELFKFLA